MSRSIFLTFECLLLTFGLPLLLWATADRFLMVCALWGGGVLSVIYLWRTGTLRASWRGAGITKDYKFMLAARFVTLTISALILTVILFPERLFSFPINRPQIWLLVMALYPILSALPQELVYRGFFFQRYGNIASPRLLMTLSAIAYGLTHLMMNNPVAPILSIFGGLLFAQSYARHKSLLWVTIEHAAYGCMIFTTGLGYFFYIGNWR
ncbi:MAG: CPBP family intramembrane glutamic endopeptidase [Bdellovibrionales bacterium]